MKSSILSLVRSAVELMAAALIVALIAVVGTQQQEIKVMKGSYSHWVTFSQNVAIQRDGKLIPLTTPAEIADAITKGEHLVYGLQTR